MDLRMMGHCERRPGALFQFLLPASLCPISPGGLSKVQVGEISGVCKTPETDAMGLTYIYLLIYLVDSTDLWRRLTAAGDFQVESFGARLRRGPGQRDITPDEISVS